MPKILINEVDKTSATGSTITDIAYVPGLMGKSGDTSCKNTPILCETIQQFEQCFGIEPAVIYKKDPEVTDDPGMEFTVNNYSMLKVFDGAVDTGYIYAKELINAGMPVLYEAIEADSKNCIKAEMGICSWPKEPTNEDFKPRENSALKDNKNNTATLVSTINKDTELFIRIKSDKALTDDMYVSVAFKTENESDIKITNIYKYDENNTTLGDEISPAADAFKLDTGLYGCIIKAVVDSEVEPALEFIQVMVSKETFAPFTYYIDSTVSGVQYLYDVLPERLEKLTDKSLFDVKYITAGGYPTFSDECDDLTVKMLNVAYLRGDAIALPDHKNEPNRVLSGPGSLYSTAIKNNQSFSTDGKYGAMFTPYGEYSCPTYGADLTLPASFAYLMCLARAIKTSPNWLAMAGVSRGVVPYISKLTCKQTLSNVIADEYQPRSGGVSINAITDIRPYGLTVYGNRTLAKAGDELKAENFLNTRVMLCDIKKQAYKTAKALMFEQDTDMLWLNFRSGITPLLDQLKSGGGISAYKLLKTDVDNKGNKLGKGQVGVVIRVRPIYAVEYFDISVVITDDVEVA